MDKFKLEFKVINKDGTNDKLKVQSEIELQDRTKLISGNDYNGNEYNRIN